MADKGRQFGKYVLQEVLGEGAMARVFRAVRSGPMGFRKQVAIKQILPHVTENDRVIKALINEARMGGYLQHKNLVEIYEFDQEGEDYYIAMEYVDGRSLLDVLRQVPEHGLLPPLVIAELSVQLCEGLAAAHAAEDEEGEPLNLVHRDLKPSNVMITHAGVAKVMDFGIAKSATNLFQTSAVDVTKGTPIYMSPEQVRGEALDGRSDQFGLGSLITELITGEVLFYDPQLMNVLRQVNDADVDEAMGKVVARTPEFEPILRRALQRNRDDRYEDTAEMAQELRLAFGDLPGPAGIKTWLQEWFAEPVAEGSGGFSAARGDTAVTTRPVASSASDRWAAEDTRVLQVPGKESPGTLVEHSHGVLMVFVEPGQFWMGSPDDAAGRKPDESLHPVRLTRPFLIGTTEVTVAQWKKVMGRAPIRAAEDDHPVTSVSWFEALQFCNRLSSLEAFTPAYRVEGGTMVRVPGAGGFRLPTEAEWEYAARGGEDRLYAGTDELAEAAWYWKNGGGMTHPVARKQPNALGLYDMSGNVSEWTWDWYGPYATDEEQVDPTGPDAGTERVVRGGSYQSVSRDVRIAVRHSGAKPTDRHVHVGFRLARSVT